MPDHSDTEAGVVAPTRRNLGEVPVHPEGGYPGGDPADRMPGAAALGFRGEPQLFPHAARIQASFGHHDVSSIKAHVGGPAADAARALGATAYAAGGRVALPSDPGLHTAAHEAAHVVQQRAATTAAATVDGPSDGHERHADAIADAVVEGRSVGAMLDRSVAAAAGGRVPAVQRQTEKGPATAPAKETQFNAKLDTAADTLIQAFDENGSKRPGKVPWNLDLITAKAAIGLKSSPKAYIEVIGNWQPGEAGAVGIDAKDRADARAATVRKALQQWGAFPDRRLRSTSTSVSIDGTAPASSYHDTEVWFRTGTATKKSWLAPGAPKLSVDPPKPDILKAPPPATVKRIKDLADLIAAAGPAVARDPLVRELRDAVAAITPFVPGKEVVKALDDAIEKGVPEGIKAGVSALLEKLGAKTTSTDPPTHTGPPLAEKDLGEKIFKMPEVPLSAIGLDPIPKLKRFSFELNGLSSAYKPGSPITFTMRTPDDFELNSPAGNSHVVILEAADFKANGGKAASVVRAKVDAKGKMTMTLSAPEKPGDYVIGVKQGSDILRSATHELTVK